MDERKEKHKELGRKYHEKYHNKQQTIYCWHCNQWKDISHTRQKCQDCFLKYMNSYNEKRRNQSTTSKNVSNEKREVIFDWIYE